MIVEQKRPEPHRSWRARVLHLLYSTSRSGVELWLLDLLPYLNRAGLGVDVVTLSRAPGAVDDELLRAGVRVTHIGTARHYRRFSARFRHILATGGPYQILHSSLPYGGIQLRLAARHGITVRIAHSHADMRPLEAQQSFGRRMINRLERHLVARYATTRIAVSPPAAEGLFGVRSPANGSCILLPCGRDYSAYSRRADRAAVRRSLGLTDASFVIGHTGRLSWQKNQKLLLQIAAEVLRHDPEARLLLVGEGELRPQLQAEAQALGIGGSVVFAGNRTDIPELLLGAMDVFVFPSHYEGLSLAVIEAQAAGLPCLMADHLTDQAIVVPELVRRIPLDAPAQAWATAVIDLAHCTTLDRKAALARVLASDFAIERHAAKVTSIYDDALARA
jgi:glycosyltransferase involved in cell wall biosynthesis